MEKKLLRLSVIVWALTVLLVIFLRLTQEPPQEVVQEVVEVVEVVEVCDHEPWEVDQEDAELLAQVTWCEARGCDQRQQAAVMWCVLNRVDDPRFPDSVRGVILQENQFYYLDWAPVTEELYDLACDVLARWQMEDLLIDSGRVLPAEYLWFAGDGTKNTFRTEYRGGETWT